MADTLIGLFTVSLQDNRILLMSHGLVDGDQVRFALAAPENVLATPLVENTFYFVVEARGNDFRVALTQGGLAVVILDKGNDTQNEVWKRAEQTLLSWQMSSTVRADLPPKEIWETKLIV